MPEGDAVYRRVVARLFSGEFEALDVLKWKDIIEEIEGAIDRLEDLGSDVVEHRDPRGGQQQRTDGRVSPGIQS